MTTAEKKVVNHRLSALQREDEFLREAFSQYEDTKRYLDWARRNLSIPKTAIARTKRDKMTRGGNAWCLKTRAK